MFAVFKTGSKQYKVQTNDVIFVEKLDGNVGQKVEFNEVLMLDGKFGTPFVKGARVICEIQKHGKQDKLLIIKHISQKHHTKTQGHRQPYTKLLVTDILEK